jgi:hypothetical protein
MTTGNVVLVATKALNFRGNTKIMRNGAYFPEISQK